MINIIAGIGGMYYCLTEIEKTNDSSKKILWSVGILIWAAVVSFI